MPFRELQKNLLVEPILDPPFGQIAAELRRFGATTLLALPAGPGDDDALEPLLVACMTGAAGVFPGGRVALLVLDRAFTGASGDLACHDAAVAGARAGFSRLRGRGRDDLLALVTPCEGYLGDLLAARGSALRMLYDELEETPVSQVVLLDPATSPPEPAWLLEACALADQAHVYDHTGDAYLMLPAPAWPDPLEELVINPLCALSGRMAPGLLGPTRALSAHIAHYERTGAWDEARLRHTAELRCVLEALDDPRTVIYSLCGLPPGPRPAPRDPEQTEALIRATLDWLATRTPVDRAQDRALQPLMERDSGWDGAAPEPAPPPPPPPWPGPWMEEGGAAVRALAGDQAEPWLSYLDGPTGAEAAPDPATWLGLLRRAALRHLEGDDQQLAPAALARLVLALTPALAEGPSPLAQRVARPGSLAAQFFLRGRDLRALLKG